MRATDQSNEGLHQQASAQYLQGKFEEALATWNRILAIDPEDERAGEGIRLCQLLTDDGSSAAPAGVAPTQETPAAAAAPAVPVDAPPTGVGETDAAASEESIEFALPSLDIDLPEIQPPDPLRQSEGIDFGAEPEVLEIDGEIPEIPAPEPSVEAVDPQPAEADVGPIVDGLFGDDTSPDVGEAAAVAELGMRAQDVVNEARAAYESGDTEAARGLLKRVFILDERNAEALELQEQIENGVPPASEQVDVADLDAPEHDATPGQFDLAADAPEAAAGAEPPPPDDPSAQELPLEASELASETLDDPADDDFPDFDVDAGFEDTEEASEVESETVEPAKGKIKLPQLDVGSSKTRWIVIGVVVGVFVVVGVGFWMKLRAVEAPPPIAAAVETAPEAAAEPVAEAQPAPVEPEPAEQPNVAPTEDVATLLERGNTAFDAGEYSQAILAFNAVLKQQPDNFEANERMQAATERYRTQQEIQQQWIAATSLFRDGEFRSAMQMFYRLPQDTEEDRVRIARYQENGWYNMGLLALRSAQCDRARGHFQEAFQIDPEDADVAMALALCDTCESGSGRSGFQRALASMKMRGLDD